MSTANKLTTERKGISAKDNPREPSQGPKQQQPQVVGKRHKRGQSQPSDARDSHFIGPLWRVVCLHRSRDVCEGKHNQL